ncbi:MAG: class I SAM-dependent methyltransferase [Pirellulaceae bacterium]
MAEGLTSTETTADDPNRPRLARLGIVAAEDASAGHAADTEARDDAPREWALPGVHAAARRLLYKLPRGRLLDLAAGEGALSKWAREQGFDVTATEIDSHIFRTADVPCHEVDLNHPLPWADASVDVVTALEIVEHLENQYQFLREIARVLKPGGHAVLSTPNEHNIQNRWTYFWTGFYGDSRHIIHEDDPDLPLRHINMIPPSQLELAWRRAGLQLTEFEISKHRPTAWLLLPFVYPLQRLRYRLKLSRIKDPREHATCRRAYDLLSDVRMLTGRVVVYHLFKPLAGDDRSNAKEAPIS